jgi:hypothetical protein
MTDSIGEPLEIGDKVRLHDGREGTVTEVREIIKMLPGNGLYAMVLVNGKSCEFWPEQVREIVATSEPATVEAVVPKPEAIQPPAEAVGKWLDCAGVPLAVGDHVEVLKDQGTPNLVGQVGKVVKHVDVGYTCVVAMLQEPHHTWHFTAHFLRKVPPPEQPPASDVTINEVRALRGRAPIAGGDKPVKILLSEPAAVAEEEKSDLCAVNAAAMPCFGPFWAVNSPVQLQTGEINPSPATTRSAAMFYAIVKSLLFVGLLALASLGAATAAAVAGLIVGLVEMDQVTAGLGWAVDNANYCLEGWGVASAVASLRALRPFAVSWVRGMIADVVASQVAGLKK